MKILEVNAKNKINEFSHIKRLCVLKYERD